MANEVTVIEMSAPRGPEIMVTPFLNTQTLSIAGAASAAFNKGASMLAIRTDTNCTIEFSNVDGTDPDGAGAGSGAIPLVAAEGWQFFSVRGGDKVIVVA